MFDLYFISDSKFQIELLPYSADFSDMLLPGETILPGGLSIIITVESGFDSNPSTMLYGLPTLLGNIVTQNIRKGVSGVIYEVGFLVQTSLGNAYRKWTELGILPLSGGAIPHFKPAYLTSQLYPYILGDSMSSSMQLISGELVLVLRYYNYQESLQASATVLSGTLTNALHTYSYEEAIKASLALVSGTLVISVLFYTPDPEAIKSAAAIISGTLINSVVYYSTPHEDIKASLALVSGTLI